jgi:hypothetical protein
MMKQLVLFDKKNNKNVVDFGHGLILEIIDKSSAALYRHGTYIKAVDLSDRIAKRLFVVEIIEMGACKSRVASTLKMSRQTIHNYLEIKKYFGLEGLVHGYSPSESKSLRKQRKENEKKRCAGNKAKQVAQIRKQEREKQEQRQLHFSFGPEGHEQTVGVAEQPFLEEHDWEATRYAGVFSYLIPLITEWKWLQLVMGYFGSLYKIFMVFVLMAAHNIRSIEQIKNIRSREAGIVLGIGRVPSKPKIWEWFYGAAEKKVSHLLLLDYFRYQIRAGLVGIWLWFTDGHLLPYTGKGAVHFSFNTQRRMPVPGQTSLVTCDSRGRIVDFEIQEGKGDLRNHIVALSQKWAEEIPDRAVMVFDREGYGAGFFSALVLEGIPFVTWDKHVDSKELAKLEEEKFTEEFELNGKKYSVFEGKKTFTYTPDDPDRSKHSFILRRIYIWNRTSGRRACGLAWDAQKGMSIVDCAYAILSRWGASENTFKHINNRHPLHYHPGFSLVTSDNQQISNPAIKKKQSMINRLKKALGKDYEKLAKSAQVLNKDCSPRKNSLRDRLKKNIQEQEKELLALQKQKEQLPLKLDVSSLQDYKSFEKIDNEGKYLFDFALSSVWNVRKQMVDWLRPFFNQENELVDLFYAITDCHGWIKSTKNEVIVRLEPLQQPKRRLAQEQLCRKLTNLGAQTPKGKWLII